jgi:hypothetical protein
MNNADARRVLGLPAEGELTLEQIKLAAARALMVGHPDHGGDGRAISAIKDARDFLVHKAGFRKIACRTCRGRGSVRATLGYLTCSVCNGTGDQRL